MTGQAERHPARADDRRVGGKNARGLDADLEHLLRVEAPQALGALVRRFGRFDIAEDAVQEALLAASRTWPDDGVPDNHAVG